jgi:hypothetical protein
VRRACEGSPPDAPAEADPSPSDPLVGGLPDGGRTRIRGSIGTRSRRGLVSVPGMTRDVRLNLWLGFLAVGGGDEETRTPDPLLAKEMLYRLSYVPAPGWGMVGVSGLEPETSALSGQCSNQLS